MMSSVEEIAVRTHIVLAKNLAEIMEAELKAADADPQKTHVITE